MDRSCSLRKQGSCRNFRGIGRSAGRRNCSCTDSARCRRKTLPTIPNCHSDSLNHSNYSNHYNYSNHSRQFLTEAFWIFVVARAALVAGSAGEVGQARALSISTAHTRRASRLAAVARPAFRITIIARFALIATSSVVTDFAQALAVFFVTDLGMSSTRIAVAICRSVQDSLTYSFQHNSKCLCLFHDCVATVLLTSALRVIEEAMFTAFTGAASEVVVALALAAFLVAHIRHRSCRLALASCVPNKSCNYVPFR